MSSFGAQVDASSNDAWISEAETPDPSPLPKVPGWGILVRPIAIRSKTKGGILLADVTKEDLGLLTNVGRVLAMGPLAYTRDDMREDGKVVPWCKVGDLVAFPKYSGAKFLVRGVKMLLINDDHVKLVVNDVEDLNPMFNLSKGSV